MKTALRIILFIISLLAFLFCFIALFAVESTDENTLTWFQWLILKTASVIGLAVFGKIMCKLDRQFDLDMLRRIRKADR